MRGMKQRERESKYSRQEIRMVRVKVEENGWPESDTEYILNTKQKVHVKNWLWFRREKNT